MSGFVGSNWGMQLQAFREKMALKTIATAKNAKEEKTNVISIAIMERHAILETIRQLNGDKLLAAKLLGIGKITLYRKLKKYGPGEVQ
jgi:transcriptional regulator with PAS, ATPase and Fis domain